MKSIEVVYVVSARLEHRTVIEVPEPFEQYDIEQCADAVYSDLAHGEFVPDLTSWERTAVLISKEPTPEPAEWTALKHTTVHGPITIDKVEVVRTTPLPIKR